MTTTEYNAHLRAVRSVRWDPATTMVSEVTSLLAGADGRTRGYGHGDGASTVFGTEHGDVPIEPGQWFGRLGDGTVVVYETDPLVDPDARVVVALGPSARKRPEPEEPKALRMVATERQLVELMRDGDAGTYEKYGSLGWMNAVAAHVAPRIAVEGREPLGDDERERLIKGARERLEAAQRNRESHSIKSPDRRLTTEASALDVGPLLEEIDRLSALVAAARDDAALAECAMTHTEPYDFASCSTHDTTFTLGEACKFFGRELWEVYEEEASQQRARAVRAEMALEALGPLDGEERESFQTEYAKQARLAAYRKEVLDRVAGVVNAPGVHKIANAEKIREALGPVGFAGPAPSTSTAAPTERTS